jgi:hypothetical protein
MRLETFDGKLVGTDVRRGYGQKIVLFWVLNVIRPNRDEC